MTDEKIETAAALVVVAAIPGLTRSIQSAIWYHIPPNYQPAQKPDLIRALEIVLSRVKLNSTATTDLMVELIKARKARADAAVYAGEARTL